MLIPLVTSNTNSTKWTESPLVCYLRLLKLRETALLTLIGACAAIIAKPDPIAWTQFGVIFAALLSGSAGANGLTNYLDRHVDVLMHRTQGRMLPSGLVNPKLALLWCLILVTTGLTLALTLHLYCFVAGLVALASAVIARKTWATHFLGSVASNGPIFVAWFAVDPSLSSSLILIGSIIAIWVPLHVWNLMIAFRNDYKRANVNIFPIHYQVSYTRWISLVLAGCLWINGNLIWFVTPFGALYGVVANALGILMFVACMKMITDANSVASYRIFKLSTYPFLGITFLALTADHVVRGFV